MDSLEIWETITHAVWNTIDTSQVIRKHHSPQKLRQMELEGELLPLVIEHQDWRPRNYVAHLESQGFDLQDSVVDALERIGLYNVNQQKLWAEKIIFVTKNLRNLVEHPEEIESPEKSLREISSFIVSVQQSFNRQSMGAQRKAFLIWLFQDLIHSYPQIEAFQVLLKEVKRVSFKDTKIIALKLFRELSQCLGLTVQFQEWKSEPIPVHEVSSSKRSEEHDHLSDYLGWLEAVVTIEREDFEKQKQMVPYQTAKAFFSKMNMVINGRIINLLDATANYLKDPEHQYEIDDFNLNVKASTPLVMELRDFFTSLGLERLREEGEKFLVCLDNVDNYEYNGSPFTYEENTKHVEVVAPGWKYKKVCIVSRPEVRELKK